MEKKYEIGNFIYQLRTERGYTQKELGALLGVTDKAVSKWETGAALPRMEVLRQLAIVLGCTQEELFLGRRIERVDATDGVTKYNAEDITAAYKEMERREIMRQCERWRRWVVIVQLCALAILAALVGVFGFNKGVWDNSAFYRATWDDDKTVYTSRSHSVSVEVLTGGEQDTIQFHTAEDQTARFTFALVENGSFKTVNMFSEDGDPVLRGTFSASKWNIEKEEYPVTVYPAREISLFPTGLSHEAILNMAAGNTESRISGKLTDLLLGTLFLALGLALNILGKLVTEADKAAIGIFYDGACNLRAAETTQMLLSLLGIALFVLGAVFYKFILFS